MGSDELLLVHQKLLKKKGNVTSNNETIIPKMKIFFLKIYQRIQRSCQFILFRLFKFVNFFNQVIHFVPHGRI
jgi:hypothetical protein